MRRRATIRTGAGRAGAGALAAVVLAALASSVCAQTSDAQTSSAQTAPQAAVTGAVATGAGRADELSEAARIDAYLADATRAPSAASAQSQVTASEAAASASAIPPMAPDSAWARGSTRPQGGPLPLAEADAAQPRLCDHKLHGEVGAEVGTGGTRGGYGVVTAPLGKDCWGQVTVGISSFQGRGYGGYGGSGYGGYGYGGFPGYGTYGRNRTQDAFSFALGVGDGRTPGPPSD